MTPYRAQAALIRSLVQAAIDNGRLPDDQGALSIGSVHAGQGSERPFVVLSLVLSTPFAETKRNVDNYGLDRAVAGLTFVDDEHIMNVALTRAQQGLLILGNAETLYVSKLWRALVDDLDARGGMAADGLLDEAVASDKQRAAWGKVHSQLTTWYQTVLRDAAEQEERRAHGKHVPGGGDKRRSRQ